MRGEWAAESLRMLGICGWLAGDFERAQRHWQEAAEMARRLAAKCTLVQVNLERGRLMQSDTELCSGSGIILGMRISKSEWMTRS